MTLRGVRGSCHIMRAPAVSVVSGFGWSRVPLIAMKCGACLSCGGVLSAAIPREVDLRGLGA
jgi:hypothetical protein